VTGTGNPRELLRVAVATRTAGDGDAARAAYVRAYDAARSGGDVEAMIEAAVGLAAGRLFGTVPGQVPAFLHEAYLRASGVLRARVAVALARAWVAKGLLTPAQMLASAPTDRSRRTETGQYPTQGPPRPLR